MNIGLGISIPFTQRAVSQVALTFGVNIYGITGALPASGNAIVTINPVANAITPAFTMSRTTGVAPLGVHFDASTTTATALTSLPFHELHYAWSFGDPAGGATWAYGTRAGVASKNTAYGPVAAHVFETPGTYTVTLWVYHLDAGGTFTSVSVAGSSQITVADPDTVFAANTLYVSQSTTPVPGANGVPIGANVEQITSWTLIGTRSATYKRIFLMRGDTWATNGTASLGTGAGVLAAYGSGNKPKVLISGAHSGINVGSNGDWRLIDIEVTSDLENSNYKLAIGAGLLNTLVLRCNLHFVQSGVQSGMGTDGVYIVDSVIDDMFSISAEAHGGPCGFFDVTDHIAIMGCQISNARKSHHIRMQGTSGSVVTNNSVTTPAEYLYNSITIRGKTTDNNNPGVWNGQYSERNVVADNLIVATNASGYTVHAGPQSTGHAERVRDLIVERNHVTSSGSDTFNFSVAGLTFRNNISSTTYSFSLSIGGAGNLAGVPASADNFIYNNVFFKRDVSVSVYYSAVAMNGGGQSNVVLKNNLSYAPGSTKDGLQNGTSPVFITTWGGTTSANYTAGSNSSDAQIKNTNPFGVAVPATPAEFTPTGYAINAGEYAPVVTDYYLSNITGVREIGAIQV